MNDINFNNKLILAPMAGYTDAAFRGLCSKYGADITVTEMVSAKSLIHKNSKTLNLLKKSKYENIVGVQLFGSNPDDMSRACKMDYIQRDFDFVDINMGCPAPKVTKNNSGAALMKDEYLAYSIVEKCVQASKIPVTVKFRLGWNNENINFIKFAKICEDAGAAAITIHARTKEQGYSGHANIEKLEELKNYINIPVVYNGDISDVESCEKAFSKGASSLMIGRASLGNPSIFSDLKKKNKVSKKNIFKSHYKLLNKYYNDYYIITSLKKHSVRYLKGLRNSSDTKIDILRSNSKKYIYKKMIKQL